MPFGPYKDFAACEADQMRKGFSKDRAGAICASLHKKITGKWPTEKNQSEDVGSCLKCGKTVKKIKGFALNDYVCPECGGELVG